MVCRCSTPTSCKATPESTCTSPPSTPFYTPLSSPHYTWACNPLYSTPEAEIPRADTWSTDNEQLMPRRLFSSPISQLDPLAGLNLKFDLLSSMSDDARDVVMYPQSHTSLIGRPMILQKVNGIIQASKFRPSDEDSKELRDGCLDLHELTRLRSLDLSSLTSQPQPLVVESPMQDSQPSPLAPAGMLTRSQGLPRLAHYKIEAISLVVPALSRTDAESRRKAIGSMADHMHAR